MTQVKKISKIDSTIEAAKLAVLAAERIYNMANDRAEQANLVAESVTCIAEVSYRNLALAKEILRSLKTLKKETQ
jgi:hypothetical protein